MNQRLAHSIKHRIYANDEFMTPPELAVRLVKRLPIKEGQLIIEPCPASGAFIKANSLILPLEGNFYDFDIRPDWIVTNPPYSDLDNWLKHCFEIADVGVALLLGLINITPRRLEMANKAGFGLTQVHLCKVFHWFGISAFCVWEKGKPDIVAYDRIVWR